MIKIENLSKVFRTEEVETVALNNVNMQVNEGEFVAIMGPSGCGKSSFPCCKDREVKSLMTVAISTCSGKCSIKACAVG